MVTCPTCGSKCNIDLETKHYEPVKNEALVPIDEDELNDIISRSMLHHTACITNFDKSIEYKKELIKEINKYFSTTPKGENGE